MSAAPELPPVVHIPERARRNPGVALRPGRASLAVVVAFPTPVVVQRGVVESAAVAAPARAFRAERWAGTIRVTRRGYVVLGVIAVVAMAALLWAAHLSAPASGGGAPAPAAVTVRAGDTLWSIASRVAPGRDPRLVVAELQRMNGLDGSALVPGEVLRTR